MDRHILPPWIPGTFAAVLTLSAQALPTAASEEPTSTEAPEEARVTRIEQGLLPAVQLRDHKTGAMSLHDRLDHYRASALSLAVIDDHEVAWARAWGTVALDREEQVTPESLFQAGSVSKSVAALVTAALVRKGELTLDQPVASLLDARPEVRAALGDRVFLRHLLAHTAGLPPYSWRGWYRDEELPSTAEMLSEAEIAPTRPPGEAVLYSNTGYLLLQLAIENATGRPFARVAGDELFSPLRLERSSFAEPLPKRLWDSAVWGHYQGEPIRGKGRMYPAAPGGLWTTAPDLARVMAELLRAAADRGSAVVPAGIAQAMLTPTSSGTDRTLGWSLEGEGEEARILGAGRVAGFTAYAVGFPARGQGLVVMSNSHGGHALNLEVARAVAAEYGWPGFLVERDVVHLSEEELGRFEGRFKYEVPAGLTITFTARDGKLYGRTGDNPEWEAVPIGEREFTTPGSDAVIRFEVDGTGRATGFRIGIPGGSWTEVSRVEPEAGGEADGASSPRRSQAH